MRYVIDISGKGTLFFPNVFISDSWLFLSRQEGTQRIVFFKGFFFFFVIVLKKKKKKAIVLVYPVPKKESGKILTVTVTSPWNPDAQTAAEMDPALYRITINTPLYRLYHLLPS